MRINKLSARKVSTITKAGLHGDGGGLWLKVTKTGTKSWVFRYTRNNKMTNMGLGSVSDVSLVEARVKALEYRQLLLDGKEPMRVKQQAIAKQQSDNKAITFKDCATQYIDSHKAEWTNAKHAQQWTNTLKAYAYPVMGNVPVKDIDETLILKVLTPIWTTKTETATRVRCRIENILNWAAVMKYRDRFNPAQWKGNLEHVLAKPGKIKRVKHHKALPYSDMHKLILLLRNNNSISAHALEFLILNASRTGEIMGALWSEIDIDNQLWIIPADRMKANKEHRVTLSVRAMIILDEMAAIRQSDFIFASTRINKGLSNGAMDMLLQRTMGYDCTVHGFRSTFRDWAAEQTNHSHEVCEAALAHTIKNQSEAAYRRGDMIEKRRNLAEDWLRFIETPPNQKAKVIPIRKAV